MLAIRYFGLPDKKALIFACGRLSFISEEVYGKHKKRGIWGLYEGVRGKRKQPFIPSYSPPESAGFSVADLLQIYRKIAGFHRALYIEPPLKIGLFTPCIALYFELIHGKIKTIVCELGERLLTVLPSIYFREGR